MGSSDEKLTVENVDEQIEQYLSQPPASELPNKTSLGRVAGNLQSIYEEERRLEQVWTRINSRASQAAIHLVEEQPTTEPIEGAKKARSVTQPGSFNSNVHKPAKQSPLPFSRKWHLLEIGLVAAALLIVLLSWPLFSYALHTPKIGSHQPTMTPVMPQQEPTKDGTHMVSGTKKYSGQYFNLQYPADWVITSVTTDSNSLQRVQFRPKATSSAFINVNALPTSAYSDDQLLHNDADVKLGTLRNTSSVTSHGISWTLGTVDLAGSAHTQVGVLEIAYANQGTPYRMELGATSDTFSSYTQVFNAMFASFYPQTSQQGSMPTSTPTTMPTVMPSPTLPSSPTANVPGVKVYSNQYFSIQYPANWVITSVATSDTYQQTVQFRPTTTSPVFVNVNVMYSSDLSGDLLLLSDPEVKLGALLSRSSVTYHGIPWTLGMVNLPGQVPTQASEVEIAYSNHNTPYKIEFSAPTNMFSSYTQVFNAMLASFYSLSS